MSPVRKHRPWRTEWWSFCPALVHITSMSTSTRERADESASSRVRRVSGKRGRESVIIRPPSLRFLISPGRMVSGGIRQVTSSDIGVRTAARGVGPAWKARRRSQTGRSGTAQPVNRMPIRPGSPAAVQTTTASARAFSPPVGRRRLAGVPAGSGCKTSSNSPERLTLWVKPTVR